MDDGKELPVRKDIRLKNYDYSSPGAYFITICTENRKQLLSKIVGGVEDVAPYETAFRSISFCVNI